MRNVFRFLGLLAVLCLPFVSLAQNDGSVSDSGGVGGSLFGSVLSLWLPLAYAVYEAVIRYVPTLKSFSPLTYLMRIINVIVPDKKDNGDGTVGVFE
jgi:hypothetical protein